MIVVKIPMRRLAELEATAVRRRRKAFLCDEQAEEVEALGEPLPEPLACPYCPESRSLDEESLAWHVQTFHEDGKAP